MRRAKASLFFLALAGCTVAPVELDGGLCNLQSDCIPGYTCVLASHFCAPTDSGVDAGRDAAPRGDADRHDSGAMTDADVDAGDMDADLDSALDAAAQDAATIDAGTDAATSDVGIDAPIAIDADIDAGP